MENFINRENKENKENIKEEIERDFVLKISSSENSEENNNNSNGSVLKEKNYQEIGPKRMQTEVGRNMKRSIKRSKEIEGKQKRTELEEIPTTQIQGEKTKSEMVKEKRKRGKFLLTRDEVGENNEEYCEEMIIDFGENYNKEMRNG